MSILGTAARAAGFAARHPVRAMKHLALNSTRAGDPMNLDELAKHLSAGSRTMSGRRVTPETVLTNSAASRAVQLIAGTVSTLPLQLMRKTKDVPVKATDHPLYDTLHTRPNDLQTTCVLVNQAMTSLALWNDAYILADGFGARRSLHVLPVPAVRPEVIDNGRGMQWRVQDGGKTRVLKLGEIIPVQGFRMPGAIQGLAVSGMHREAISLALSAEEYGAKFFATGGRPSGVLSTDVILKKEQREQLRESFKDLLQSRGVEDLGMLHVLEGGMKYQPISTAPEDSQFLQTRKHMVNEVARIFGVPPHLLAEMDRATYANAETNSREFLRFTLMHYIVPFEQALTAFLLSKEDRRTHFVKFSVDGLLRADSTQRADQYMKMRSAGVYSINDCRALEDLPPVPGGDDVHVPMNWAPSQDLASILGEGDSST